ncbi:MAG: hypothetical protein GY861_18775 [bacterium]|nr:hypothetical protein [bacterium]
MTEWKTLEELWQGEPIDVDLKTSRNNPCCIVAQKPSGSFIGWNFQESSISVNVYEPAKLHIPEKKMVPAWPILLYDGEDKSYRMMAGQLFTSEESAKNYLKENYSDCIKFISLIKEWPPMIPEEGE